MATTLRIAEELYREAKAAAARQGTTVTRFIEDALKLKLRQAGLPRRADDIQLPTFAGGTGFPFSPETLKSLARRTERAHDRSKVRPAKRGRRR